MCWFYRPEEAAGGRKPFHGRRELFASDHVDWVSAASIEAHCHVDDLRTHQARLAALGDGADAAPARPGAPALFFTRFSYRAAARRFAPNRVPVFCVCEMPYNPDVPMVECVACAEWYHPGCLPNGDAAAATAAAARPGGFVCRECAAGGAR